MLRLKPSYLMISTTNSVTWDFYFPLLRLHFLYFLMLKIRVTHNNRFHKKPLIKNPF